MIKSLELALLCALPAWPLTPPPASPQSADEPATPGLLEVVPAEALAFLSVHDLAGLRADFERNAWGRMLLDAEMRELWAWVRGQLESDLPPEDLSDLQEHLPALLEALQGDLVVFLLGGPDSGEGFGVLMAPGEGRPAFEEFLADVRDDDDSDRDYEEYRGVSLALSEHVEEPEDAGAEPEEPSAEQRVEFELDGVWCMLGTPERDWTLEVAHGVIERLQGSGEAGIEASPLLGAARASGFTGRIEAFVDTHAAVAMIPELSEDLGAEGQRAVDALGAAGITWVHATADLGEGEALDLHLRLPTPASGYLADWLAALGPVPARLAELGPADAVQAALYNVDVYALWESAWDLVADLEPEAYEQGRAALDGALQSFGGLDLEGDLLAQLTGELALFTVPVPEAEALAGQQLAEVEGVELPEELRFGDAYVVGLEDGSVVELFLEDALNALGMMTGLGAAGVRSEDYQGHSIQVLDLPTGGSFSWIFTDELWIGSLYPSGLRSVLALLGQEDAPSIARSERFAPHIEAHAGASVLTLAPSDTAAGIGFGVLKMFGELGGAALAGGESGWSNEELGEPTGWSFAGAPIPDGALASRYLEGTVISLVEHAREERVLHFSFLAR